MKSGRWLLAIVLLFFPLSSRGEEVSITSSTRPEAGTISDFYTFTITITGVQGVAPKMIPSPDFSAQYIGPRSQISIVNGDISTTVSHVYQLKPLREGSLKTPEASLEYQGKTLVAPPLTVEVGSSPFAPSEDFQDELILNQTVSKEQCYRGEQVINSIELLSQLPLIQPQLQEESIDGVWQEPVGNEEQGRTFIKGKSYRTVTLKRALYPLRSGEIEIPPREVRAKVPMENAVPLDPFASDFFGNFLGAVPAIKAVSVKSHPYKIKVLPLPPLPEEVKKYEQRNPIVGETELRLETRDTTATVGEGIEIKGILTSMGNISPVKELPFASSTAYKLYQERPVVSNFENNKQLVSLRTWKITVIPLRPGTLTIESPALAYFDPGDAAWKIAKGRSLEFSVTGESLLAPEASPTASASPTVSPSPTSSVSPSPSPTSAPLVFAEETVVDQWKARLSPTGWLFTLLTFTLVVGSCIALFISWRARPKKRTFSLTATPEELRKLLFAEYGMEEKASPRDLKDKLLTRAVAPELRFLLESFFSKLERALSTEVDDESLQQLRKETMLIFERFPTH